MLGDGEVPVGLNFSDGVANISKAWHLLEKGIVASTTLGPALDNMTRSQRTSQGVIVVALPVKLPRRGSDHDCGISNPRANHNICPLIQGFLDTPAAQVGIGSQCLLIGIF